MTKTEIEEVLWSDGTKPDPEGLRSLYGIAIDASHRVSEWRASTNKFALSVIGGDMAVIGWLLKGEASIPQDAIVWPLWFGFAFSLIWWVLLRQFRTLNRAKFQVIHAMEEKLPVRIFTAESKALESRAFSGLSAIESALPLLSAAAFLAAIFLVFQV